MNSEQIMVKMVFDRWHSLLKSFNEILDGLTDEQLETEISPNRNRGIYLLGHLVAVHDSMLPLLGFSGKLYPELSGPFITSPDKTVSDIPSAKTLREYWNKVNNLIEQRSNEMQPQQWFERHTAVTPEDFVMEPFRNKLNIMLTRSTHLAYHSGQFILINK